MNELEREREFYRRQTDDLGGQVLRLQKDLVEARRDARRNRTTTTVMRDLYQLASAELTLAEIGESLIAMLVDTLSADCAAILAWDRERGGFAVKHGRGLHSGTVIAAASERAPTTCDSTSIDDALVDFAEGLSGASGLTTWVWSSHPSSGFALLVGDASGHRMLRQAFDAGDKQTVEAAIAAYGSIAELKRVEQALRTSEANYRAIFENVNDAIAVAEVEQGAILDANDKAIELLGYGLEELRHLTVADLVATDECSSQELVRERAKKALRGDPQLFELSATKRSGETFSAEINLKMADVGGERRLLAVLRDISERKRVEQHLRHTALHDALTGLPNRALVLERLGQAQSRQRRRSDYVFGLLFLDLNRFKVINDSLGHAVGDKLLVAIGHRLRGSMRPADTVARLGGDEFVVLLDEIRQSDDATRAAERVKQELARPFSIDGHEIHIGGSIGIALSQTIGERPEDILRDADIAMYRAKAAGKDQVAVFDPNMHRQAVERMRLERDLRRAVINNEFQLNYQPVVDLVTHKIIAFEALVRWQHPEHGLVSPIAFIPLAEETGLIVALGRLVLEEACKRLRAWEEQFPDAFPFYISVNLSGKQVAEPGLVDDVERIIQTSGCNRKYLALEITESAIVDNTEAAKSTLQRLRDMHIRLYMDDFGTGYSSLSYLHQFPIDVLKIDRSFVRQMDTEQDGMQIIKTIVALGHNLGKSVVAEGLETRDQIERLAAMNCDFGQGYFFSKPVDCQGAERLLVDGIPDWRVPI